MLTANPSAHTPGPNPAQSSGSTAVQTRPAALPALEALRHTLSGQTLLAVSAALLVAVCAHLSVRLWFTPVPLTLSDFAVLLVGLTLGPRIAFAALVLYLAEGAAGLPVFAPGGLGGVAQLLGPTGGFLLSYPFAAALAGALARIPARIPRYALAFTAALAGSTLLMSAGAAWFSLYAHHAAALTWHLAVLPFLPGQAVKIFAAAGIYASLRGSAAPESDRASAFPHPSA